MLDTCVTRDLGVVSILQVFGKHRITMHFNSRIEIRPPLVRLCFVALFIATLFAFMVADILKSKGDLWGIALIGGVLLLASAPTIFMVSRSYWAIDDVAVYKGISNRVLFELSEIEHARVGMYVPRKWQSMEYIPIFKLGRLIRMLNAAQANSLVVRLRGNRWFVWAPRMHANDQAFIDRILKSAPDNKYITLPQDLTGILQRGRIIQG